MCKKIVSVACVVVLSMAMTVSANDWANAGDGKWSTAANWSNGVPTTVADVTGNVFINQSGANAVTIDGTQPQAFACWLHIASAVGGTGTLNVVAGGKIGQPTANAFQAWIGEGGAGILNVDGAGSVARAENWNIGSAGGSGVVNITNGGELVGVWWGNFIKSTGTINVISGKMTILGEGAFTIDPGGLINISGTSTLTMDGDRTGIINGYIASGAIKGNGVQGNVVAAFANGVTLVTATPEPMTLALLGLGGLFLRRRKA